jgi:hypothetical protein
VRQWLSLKRAEKLYLVRQAECRRSDSDEEFWQHDYQIETATRLGVTKQQEHVLAAVEDSFSMAIAAKEQQCIVSKKEAMLAKSKLNAMTMRIAAMEGALAMKQSEMEQVLAAKETEMEQVLAANESEMEQVLAAKESEMEAAVTAAVAADRNTGIRMLDSALASPAATEDALPPSPSVGSGGGQSVDIRSISSSVNDQVLHALAAAKASSSVVAELEASIDLTNQACQSMLDNSTTHWLEDLHIDDSRANEPQASTSSPHTNRVGSSTGSGNGELVFYPNQSNRNGHSTAAPALIPDGSWPSDASTKQDCLPTPITIDNLIDSLGVGVPAAPLATPSPLTSSSLLFEARFQALSRSLDSSSTHSHGSPSASSLSHSRADASVLGLSVILSSASNGAGGSANKSTSRTPVTSGVSFQHSPSPQQPSGNANGRTDDHERESWQGWLRDNLAIDVNLDEQEGVLAGSEDGGSPGGFDVDALFQSLQLGGAGNDPSDSSYQGS